MAKKITEEQAAAMSDRQLMLHLCDVLDDLADKLTRIDDMVSRCATCGQEVIRIEEKRKVQ